MFARGAVFQLNHIARTTTRTTVLYSLESLPGLAPVRHHVGVVGTADGRKWTVPGLAAAVVRIEMPFQGRYSTVRWRSWPLHVYYLYCTVGQTVL